MINQEILDLIYYGKPQVQVDKPEGKVIKVDFKRKSIKKPEEVLHED